MLSVERLEQTLGVRPFQYLETTASTNDVAMRWLPEGAPAGGIVTANEQVQGRGRLGRTWYAPPGTALMLSYVLRPAADDLPYIGMAGAVAVQETIQALGIEGVGLKWPNDVQIDGRKVCGILPEAAWQNGALLGVVLGIGVNVRIDFAGTPFEHTAISLEQRVSPLDRAELLARLAERLDVWTARLSADELFERWQAGLVMLGRSVSIATVTGTITGTAEAVERQGALVVRDAHGVLQRVIAGDIALG